MSNIYNKIVESMNDDIANGSWTHEDVVNNKIKQLCKEIKSTKMIGVLSFVVAIFYMLLYVLLRNNGFQNEKILFEIPIISIAFASYLLILPCAISDATCRYREFLREINAQASIIEIKSVIKESEQIGIMNIKTYLDRKGDFISKLDIIACNKYLSNNWKQQ